MEYPYTVESKIRLDWDQQAAFVQYLKKHEHQMWRNHRTANYHFSFRREEDLRNFVLIANLLQVFR
jgi:hypothetical protein